MSIDLNSSHRVTNAPLASRRDAPVYCADCGRKVERKSRQQRYCSARCQEKARTRVRKAVLGRDTRAPGNPPKKHSKFKALPTGKTLSSRRILAPADVLAAEVFGGRVWQGATSSGGVAIQVSRLRQRALVERTRPMSPAAHGTGSRTRTHSIRR
jgi:hypothetical protein